MFLLRAIAFCCGLGMAMPVASGAVETAYDGAWSLSIVTERGGCDSYNFPVQIINGTISFPGLTKASGSVASNGAIRVSVAAEGKDASGSGKLSGASGRGRWTGQAGGDKCSGYWTAQRS